MDPHQRRSSESGQASISLVAVVPPLVIAALAAIQFALAGHAALSAATAARAAARAAYAGTDVKAAVRGALPENLRGGSRVALEEDRAEVRVLTPPLLPFLPELPIGASALLGPEDGSSDG